MSVLHPAFPLFNCCHHLDSWNEAHGISILLYTLFFFGPIRKGRRGHKCSPTKTTMGYLSLQKWSDKNFENSRKGYG